jgi:outer membrane immunogenic protein
MRLNTVLAVSTGLAALALATPAAAQSDDDAPFSGFYVSDSVGVDLQQNDVGESILFDRNLDGTFGDTLTTTTGANAFSTGFCNGKGRGPTSTDGAGCANDSNTVGYSGRIGYDRQFGNIVLGIVGEVGRSEIRDSVTAFSITPANYIMNRQIDVSAGLRARLGYAADNTLFYATGGGAYARVNNVFTTTNTVNTFTNTGNSNAFGYSAGGGLEQKVSRNVSIGLEYLYTSLKDDDYRVRVSGGPATSPFTLGGAGGTDFRRSSDYFRYSSLRATVAYRF